MVTGSNLSGSYGPTETLRVVHYGPGSLETALPEILDNWKPSKAFIVTGKSLRTKTDIITRIEALLKSRDAYGGTLSSIEQHSPIAQIRTGIEEIKKSGSNLIVAVGGGSPIDAAKAMIYYLQKEEGGEFIRQIAIPTTLSAAEYTSGAGHTSEKGHKTGVTSPQLAPAAIILDGELALHTPERLWLSTGIRALDHAVESFYREGFPRPLHALSYGAIKDLFTYLPQSRERPKDVEIRQRLLIAAWMSLWPYRAERGIGLGLSHGLGHRLGATYSIGHGITSCLTLGPVIKLKAKYASVEDKQALAEVLFYLGIPTTGNLENDVTRLGEEIEDLVQRLGLYTTLKEHHVPAQDLDIIASVAKHIPQDANHYDEIRDMLTKL